MITNSVSREPELCEKVYDEDSKSIQAWLKFHKCENFLEIIGLWEDTMEYRCWQTKHLKDLDSIREFLNNWPTYKLETAHELVGFRKYTFSKNVKAIKLSPQALHILLNLLKRNFFSLSS